MLELEIARSTGTRQST